MAPSRFERLERERAPEGESAGAGRSSRVERRFGGSADGHIDEGPARSGAEATRFAEPEDGERLRVLDTDEGQAFVRCARCRSDNHVTASRCGNCEADLATPEQRAFNEALWRKLEAEKAEEKRAVEALRERRAAAEREQAGAMRRRQELEAELERRRALGLPLDDAYDVRDPLIVVARALGRLLGRGLARALPNRRRRRAAGGVLAVVVGAAVAFGMLSLLRLPSYTIFMLVAGFIWIGVGVAGRYLADREERRARAARRRDRNE